jgi:hypothetical protein
MLPYHSRKHTLNEEFFLSWSPKMAYVLGFWYADGNISHIRSYRIRFYSNDQDIIEDIKTAVGSSSPIYHKSRGGIPEKCSSLNLHSKLMYNSLIKLGGMGRKSIYIKFPPVPITYLRDFIRGYFDGDGSVHQVQYEATKNGKIYTEIRSGFTCGSKSFLTSLRNTLVRELKVSKRVISQYGPHQFKLCFGQNDTGKLLKYMYYLGNPISLGRKEEYLDFFSSER